MIVYVVFLCAGSVLVPLSRSAVESQHCCMYHQSCCTNHEGPCTPTQSTPVNLIMFDAFRADQLEHREANALAKRESTLHCTRVCVNACAEQLPGHQQVVSRDTVSCGLALSGPLDHPGRLACHLQVADACHQPAQTFRTRYMCAHTVAPPIHQPKIKPLVGGQTF